MPALPLPPGFSQSLLGLFNVFPGFAELLFCCRLCYLFALPCLFSGPQQHAPAARRPHQRRRKAHRPPRQHRPRQEQQRQLRRPRRRWTARGMSSSASLWAACPGSMARWTCAPCSPRWAGGPGGQAGRQAGGRSLHRRSGWRPGLGSLGAGGVPTRSRLRAGRERVVNSGPSISPPSRPSAPPRSTATSRACQCCASRTAAPRAAPLCCLRGGRARRRRLPHWTRTACCPGRRSPSRCGGGKGGESGKGGKGGKDGSGSSGRGGAARGVRWAGALCMSAGRRGGREGRGGTGGGGRPLCLWHYKWQQQTSRPILFPAI